MKPLETMPGPKIPLWLWPVGFFLLGRTSIDVSTFSPNRFDPKAVDAYLATTVTQQDAVRRRH